MRTMLIYDESVMPRREDEVSVWCVTVPVGEGYLILLTEVETRKLRSLLKALTDARQRGNGSWTDTQVAAYVEAHDAVCDFLFPATAEMECFDPGHMDECIPEDDDEYWP